MIQVNGTFSTDYYERNCNRKGCWDGTHHTRTRFTYLEKPDEPIISEPDSSGYRKPTPWYTSVGPLVVPAHVSGQKIWPDGLETNVYGTASFVPRRSLPSLSDVTTQNAINTLRIKIRNNVADEILDASMVLAEIMETASTAASLLERIGRSMLAFKKANRKGFYYLLNGRLPRGRRPTDQFLRQTAGEYLQWKYGIMPTVLDLEGVCRGLDANADNSLWTHPPILTARANIKNIENSMLEMSNGWKTVQVPLRTTTSLKGRCDYSVSGEGLRGLNRYGIGLATLPTILFDKTPFSFVLNMAVPISDLIKAWNGLAGCNVVSYCETYYLSYSTMQSTVHGDIAWGDKKMLFDLSKADSFAFRRAVFNTVPLPLPVVRNPLKVGNIATAVALFTQLRQSNGIK